MVGIKEQISVVFENGTRKNYEDYSFFYDDFSKSILKNIRCTEICTYSSIDKEKKLIVSYAYLFTQKPVKVITEGNTFIYDTLQSVKEYAGGIYDIAYQTMPEILKEKQKKVNIYQNMCKNIYGRNTMSLNVLKKKIEEHRGEQGMYFTENYVYFINKGIVVEDIYDISNNVEIYVRYNESILTCGENIINLKVPLYLCVKDTEVDLENILFFKDELSYYI